MTGAEKPRSRDGSGFSAISTKVKDCSASVIASTRLSPAAASSPCRRSGSGWPAAPSRPISTGMTNGALVCWPGVGGQLWRKLRV
ncbi:hypothetical protein D3C76_1256490 [compost metagenome]